MEKTAIDRKGQKSGRTQRTTRQKQSTPEIVDVRRISGSKRMKVDGLILKMPARSACIATTSDTGMRSTGNQW